MPHLPWAESDNDEFLHPSHGWYLLSRAIVHDSWLSWRLAIPDDRYARRSMPLHVSTSIAMLAHGIHGVHETIPGYEDLDDNPFHVPRWWDPSADDEWNTGCRILFRIQGLSASMFEAAAHEKYPRNPPIEIKTVSGIHLEATLLMTPAVLHPWIGTGSLPPAGHQTSSGRRRKKGIQPPPAQISDSSLLSPLLEQN